MQKTPLKERTITKRNKRKKQNKQTKRVRKETLKWDNKDENTGKDIKTRNKQRKKQINKQILGPENTENDVTNKQGNQKPTC